MIGSGECFRSTAAKRCTVAKAGQGESEMEETAAILILKQIEDLLSRERIASR
jgi:hypothetical protein